MHYITCLNLNLIYPGTYLSNESFRLALDLQIHCYSKVALSVEPSSPLSNSSLQAVDSFPDQFIFSPSVTLMSSII